ncbi:MAG: hypothetical protein EBS42_13015, partial [Caulobacteraceae bacterium]|nr:hypothetical protein [Caulobacteraceae bacterium]
MAKKGRGGRTFQRLTAVAGQLFCPRVRRIRPNIWSCLRRENDQGVELKSPETMVVSRGCSATTRARR